MDSLQRQLDLLKGISEKAISFQCYFSLKEVTYFYKNTLNEVRARLKNPISAKFDEFYISKYKPQYNSYVNTTPARLFALYAPGIVRCRWQQIFLKPITNTSMLFNLLSMSP